MPKNNKPAEYQSIFSKDFLKELKSIIKGGNRFLKDRVQVVIEELKIDPFTKRSGVDLKLISSKKDSVYRVRIGKYRMIYQVDNKDKKIFITMIFVRERGY
jgi:addiction module RelE/StbE family toxin